MSHILKHSKKFSNECLWKEPIIYYPSKSIYEARLFVCLFVLFCFVLYLWDPPNQDASDGVLGLFRKLLRRRRRRRGALAWFHGVWTCSARVLEYWMISSLKIKLNFVTEIFGRIGMCLWYRWKDLDEQDLMKFIW